MILSLFLIGAFIALCAQSSTLIGSMKDFENFSQPTSP